MATLLDAFIPYIIALAIGAIIGIERERRDAPSQTAGSRTLPLVALLGALVQGYLPHVVLAGFILIVIFVMLGYIAKVYLGHGAGLTSSIATILVFVFGVMTTTSEEALRLAVILSALTMVLLALKGPIHSMAHGIEEEEQLAMVKFALVAFVIVPLLPNEASPYLLGLNPRFIWLIVVFVATIDLVGYVLTKVLGSAHGLAITGFVGGVISSTATTVSMARRTRRQSSLRNAAALAIAAASLIMWPRILLEVAVVNAALLPHIAPAIIAMALTSVGFVAWLYYRNLDDRRDVPDIDVKNPFRLQPALVFGLIFAVLLLGTRYLQQWFGDAGVYSGAILGGLLDVDAITLSFSKIARDGRVSEEVASRGIIIGAASNTFVKTGIAWFMGDAKLGRLILLVNGTVLFVGLIAVFAL